MNPKVQTHFRSRIKGKKDASHFVPGPFRAGLYSTRHISSSFALHLSIVHHQSILAMPPITVCFLTSRPTDEVQLYIVRSKATYHIEKQYGNVQSIVFIMISVHVHRHSIPRSFPCPMVYNPCSSHYLCTKFLRIYFSLFLHYLKLGLMLGHDRAVFRIYRFMAFYKGTIEYRYEPAYLLSCGCDFMSCLAVPAYWHYAPNSLVRQTTG